MCYVLPSTQAHGTCTCNMDKESCTVVVSVFCSGVGVAGCGVGVVCCDEVRVVTVTCDMESGDSGLMSPYAITSARSCW